MYSRYAYVNFACFVLNVATTAINVHNGGVVLAVITAGCALFFLGMGMAFVVADLLKR